MLAFLCEKYAWQLKTGGEEAAGQSIAQTTFYELGTRIFDRKPGGRENTLLRESLKRLWHAEVKFTNYNPELSQRVEGFHYVGRFLVAYSAYEVEYFTERQLWDQLGAKRDATIQLHLAPWLANNIAAGFVTYLNFAIMKKLPAQACRIWVYLEAESYKAGRGETEGTWIGLGRPALASLGVDNYERTRDARAALARAGVAICKVDPKYKSVKVVENNHGGWDLRAERWTGEARKRALDVRAKMRGALSDE